MPSSTNCIALVSVILFVMCEVCHWQGLLRHMVGRSWRRQEADVPAEVAQLLRWFWDSPLPEHPLSIHGLCAAGRPHGCDWCSSWDLTTRRVFFPCFFLIRKKTNQMQACRVFFPNF
jgi:hypothetical protein